MTLRVGILGFGGRMGQLLVAESLQRDDIQLAALYWRQQHDGVVLPADCLVSNDLDAVLAACDVAIAAKDTKFRFSEVCLGLTPATIAPYVVEAIGPRWAKALFASAESFDAEWAEKIGLVQYTVEDEAGLKTMMEHVSDLALAAAPGAVSDAKALVRFVTGHKIDDALSKETAKRIAVRRASAEGKEGLAAFLEKRKPEWNS